MLAVASGKGGVGKSSLTVEPRRGVLARSASATGVLDADIYGHSIPHMLGISQRPVVVDKMIVPPVKDDLKLMSIGFFLDDNAPVMWRGPMLHRALEQFLSDVHWGELDVLLVDMPPGTGDVSISLGQLLPRAEAVIVTTPQPLAQEVAVARGADGAEDEHAPDRRDREHDLRGLRHGRRRAPGGADRRAAARHGAARPARCASAATRASRSSGREPDAGDRAGDRRDRRGDPTAERRQTFKALPVLVG